jgi:hypothetical protein
MRAGLVGPDCDLHWLGEPTLPGSPRCHARLAYRKVGLRLERFRHKTRSASLSTNGRQRWCSWSQESGVAPTSGERFLQGIAVRTSLGGASSDFLVGEQATAEQPTRIREGRAGAQSTCCSGVVVWKKGEDMTLDE